jgi:hypothetical protein
MRFLLRFAVLPAFLLAGGLLAAPINPEAHKRDFEDKKKEAEVVAQVRVVGVVCSAVGEGEKAKPLTLQVALQVLAVEKGNLKKNDVVVVSHIVTPPSGPGPGAYGYMAAIRRFPFTPGVVGDVALNWDKEKRAYVGLAGWVAEPNNAAIPMEVGKALGFAEKGPG